MEERWEAEGRAESAFDGLDDLHDAERGLCDGGLYSVEDAFVHLDGILAQVSVLYGLEPGAAPAHQPWVRVRAFLGRHAWPFLEG